MADNFSKNSLAERAARLETTLVRTEMRLDSLPGVLDLFDQDGWRKRWNESLKYLTAHPS
jgi:hypothetical protein